MCVGKNDIIKSLEAFKEAQSRLEMLEERRNTINTRISVEASRLDMAKREADEKYGTSDPDKLRSMLEVRHAKNIELIGELNAKLDLQESELNEATRQLELLEA